MGIHIITVTYGGNSNFLASTSSTLTETILSAQQETALMVDQVNSLVTAGSLSSGNGDGNANALTSKLTSAIASLNGGNTTVGINQLNAFINQVAAFQNRGKLTSAQAQALISAANLASNAASGGSGAHLMNQDASGAGGSADSQPVSDAGQLVGAPSASTWTMPTAARSRRMSRPALMTPLTCWTRSARTGLTW